MQFFPQADKHTSTVCVQYTAEKMATSITNNYLDTHTHIQTYHVNFDDIQQVR